MALIRPFLVQLKAIDDLKDKLAKGEKLECVLFLSLASSLPCCSSLTLSIFFFRATQVQKIKSEAAIKAELEALQRS